MCISGGVSGGWGISDESVDPAEGDWQEQDNGDALRCSSDGDSWARSV